MVSIPRNPTRSVRIGTVTIGAGHPIAVQSMTATPTQDIDATVAQVRDLDEAGADVVRIAVDSRRDAEGAGRNPPADHGQSLGRSAGELSPGEPMSPRTSTRSATTPAISITTSAKSRGRRR